MKHPLAAYDIFFGSLANPNRIQILTILHQGQKNVTEICASTGFEQTMVSHNLKRLERCGMVFMKRRGKYRYYSLNQETIKPLMTLIDKHMGQYCVHLLFKGEHHENHH